MRFTFTAPKLNSPTFVTLKGYSKQKFKKIQKFLYNDRLSNTELRISAQKVKEVFEVSVQSFGKHKAIIKTKNRDLRKAVDNAVDSFKRALRDMKERKHYKKPLREVAKSFE